MVKSLHEDPAVPLQRRKNSPWGRHIHAGRLCLGTLSMGINASISFVKAATKGILFAEAKEQSLNPKLASYSVTVTDEENDVVAIFQGMVYRKKQSLVPFDNDRKEKAL